MQDRPKFMLGRATPSSGQAQKRRPKHERESTAGPACEQEAKEKPLTYARPWYGGKTKEAAGFLLLNRDLGSPNWRAGR